MPKPEIHKELVEVLADVRDRGFEVRKRQYRNWRGERLVPGPSAQTGLGRGTRKYAYYPPRTADQVATIAWALEQHRSLDWAGWVLWTRQFPVTHFVRKQLTEILEEQLENLQGGIQRFREGNLDNPMRYAETARRIPEVGRMRKRIGKNRMSSPAWLTVALLSDELSESTLQDRDFLDVILDGVEALVAPYWSGHPEFVSTFQEDFPQWIDRVRCASLPKLLAALDAKEDRELEQLRERARVIFLNWVPDAPRDGVFPAYLFTMLFVFDRFDIPLGELVAGLRVVDIPVFNTFGKLIQSLALTGEVFPPDSEGP